MKKRTQIRLIPILFVMLMGLACGPLDVIRDLAVSAVRGTATPTQDPSTILYVSPDGDDDNDCRSSDTPCRYIRTAIDRAEPGYLILLAAGVYDEWDPYVAASVHIDKPLTLRGSGMDFTAIVGAGPEYHVVDVNADGMVIIEDLRIEDGVSPTGIGLLTNSPVTLRNVLIRRNTCGIQSTSELIMENVRVRSNLECGIVGSAVNIQNSVIARNGRVGISIRDDGTGVISGTTIRDNGSGVANGISNSGTVTISGSTISGNSGDGINNRGELVIENSTISGNLLAGIFNFGRLSINHTTIADNHNFGLATSSRYIDLLVSNALIVENEPADCHLTIGMSYFYTFEGTTIDSDESCWNWAEGEPGPVEIGPLADNGGPTMTHALLLGNPAIDSAAGACLETDQRGTTRPQGSACDVGAFEVEFFGDAPLVPLSGEAPEGFPTGPTTCRSGPSVVYPPLAYFDRGDILNLHGRNADASWLEVQGEGAPTCWVNEDLLEVNPDFDLMDLPPGVIPPTPTWTPLPPTNTPGPQGCWHQGPNDNQPLCYLPCPPNPNPGGACTP